MVIDYQNREVEAYHNFKGGTGDMLAKMDIDQDGKFMWATLKPGSTTGYHVHETSNEVVYIISGEANFLYDGKEEIVTAGNAHYCPRGHGHSLRNYSSEDLVYFAVVPELKV